MYLYRFIDNNGNHVSLRLRSIMAIVKYDDKLILDIICNNNFTFNKQFDSKLDLDASYKDLLMSWDHCE